MLDRVAGFPSAEWAELMRRGIEGSREYASAAQAWEGDVLLRVLPEDPAAPVRGIHLDLAHGKCLAATFLPDSRGAESQFVLEADPPEWRRILTREVDPVREVLSGRLKMRGTCEQGWQ